MLVPQGSLTLAAAAASTTQSALEVSSHYGLFTGVLMEVDTDTVTGSTFK